MIKVKPITFYKPPVNTRNKSKVELQSQDTGDVYVAPKGLSTFTKKMYGNSVKELTVQVKKNEDIESSDSKGFSLKSCLIDFGLAVASQFLVTFTHELGHAATNYLLTGKSPKIFLGGYPGEREPIFDTKYLAITSVNPFQGATSGERSSPVVNILTALAGPIFGSLGAGLLCLHLDIKKFAITKLSLLFRSSAEFTCGLIPSQDVRNNITLKNDGMLIYDELKDSLVRDSIPKSRH